MRAFFAILLFASTALAQITVSGPGSFSDLSGKPTTLSGYGITDAASAVDWDGKNVVHVSKGDAATDTRTGLSKYDRDRPFLTLTAAKAAAASGDTIVVWPGTYNEYNIAKNGVNWHFVLGARVVYSSAHPGGTPGIFRDTGTTPFAGISFKVTGDGHFEWAAGGAAYVAYFEGDDSDIFFECLSATSNGSDVFGADAGSNCRLIFRLKDKVTASGDAFYAALASGEIIIEAKEVVAGTTILVNESVAGATVKLKAEKATCNRLAVNTDGTAYVSITDVVCSDATTGSSIEGGTIFIRDTKITCSNANASAITKSGGTLVLQNVVLAAGGSADSISAPTAQTVTINGGSLNRPLDADVTVTGSYNDSAGDLVGPLDGSTTNKPTTIYAAGTAYSLTNTAALLDFGTTDPTVTLTQAGTYLITARGYLKYNGATYAGNETATLKLRRTNNTAADVTNASTTATLRIITTLTDTIGIMPLPPVIYSTANADDAISIFGSVSAAPAAGSVDCSEAAIVAIRLY